MIGAVREGRLLEILERVMEADAGRISTHYEMCYLHHAPCLAVMLEGVLRGD
jgi:hypothetical protein